MTTTTDNNQGRGDGMNELERRAERKARRLKEEGERQAAAEHARMELAAKIAGRIAKCPGYVRNYIDNLQRKVRDLETRAAKMDGEREPTSIFTREYVNAWPRINLHPKSEVVFILDGGTEEYKGKEIGISMRDGALRICSVANGRLSISPDASNVFTLTLLDK